jgi:dimethylaniline monooxygenase (N-oxide forming)
MARSLNVCVVGAGMSGLVAIKELLDEGHRVTCFERTPKEGGNFNYPIGAAYDAMYLTVSQYHMAFSCFPPPYGDERRFWKREEYAAYLHDFATHFGLFTPIKFNTEIVKIQRLTPEKFHVTSRDKQTDTVTVTEFDAVAVCSGAHAVHIPRIPKFEGTDTFRGEIEHSVHYKSAEPFRGKHVVCVGFGETAADVTYQIAEVAASCWTTFRRYPAVIKRYYGPHTHDSYTTRIQGMLPRFVINRMLLQDAQRTLDAPPDKTDPGDRLLAEWTLKCGTPSHQPLQKNDDFVHSIIAGKLQVKPYGIQRLEEDSVVFTDGSRVKADVLMCCTGYDEGKPPSYLIEGIDIAEVRQLYKHTFHPDLGERVAFIGWARPAQGGIPACSEMQSRYFALLCSGKRTLPEQGELRRLIAQDREAEERAFYARKYQGTVVSYTTYMDEVAELVGCRPRVRDFLFNPRMVYHLLCGANIPTVYRLRGPHADPAMAKRVMMSLDVAHSPRELATLSYLHLLNRLGVLAEPEEAKAYEKAPA